jgi:hypothetical protein
MAEFLVREGRARGAIVIGHSSGPFHAWIAGELQRYLALLSGAEFPIVEGKAPSGTNIVLGDPGANNIAASVAQREYGALRDGGFLLQTTVLDGHPALLVGGNDESSTMYAAYELLERLGLVFQITGDLIPQRKPDLLLPSFQLRMHPALKRRGLHVRHFVMPWMGRTEFQQLLDQLAKMKCNYLEFYWYVGAPWIEFSYRGEKKLIGDLYSKESGYTTWRVNTATFVASDVKIGRELFTTERICAPEFQDCQTPEEAHHAARHLLTEVIQHAHRRKIEVWLGMGDCPGVPPNLGRWVRHRRWEPTTGTMVSPGDPAGVEIWAAAVRSMIRTYPAADGHWVWLAEDYYHHKDSDSQKVIARYDRYRKLIPTVEQIRELGYDRPTRQEDLESDIGLMHFGRGIIQEVMKDYPSARLGIAVLGRSYLFRALDAILPRKVALSSMESSGVWNRFSRVPMRLYEDVKHRDCYLIPRLDDDESELGMQFNNTLYHHDGVIADSVTYGLTGVAPQTGKLRGLEHNARFIAEGAWQPSLTPQQFYSDYAARLFGDSAAAGMSRAFLTLESNEKHLGWRGFGNFLNYADMPEILMMRLFRFQANPFEGPDAAIEKATFHFHAPEHLNAKSGDSLWVQAHRYKLDLFAGALTLLRRAEAEMDSERNTILPGALDEFDYLIRKTRNFAKHLEAVRYLLAGYLAYDEAFRLKQAGNSVDFRNALVEAEVQFQQARRRAEEAAAELVRLANDPSEKYILFRYNVRFLRPIEEFCRFVRNIVTFHHGGPYWDHVNWDVIAPSYLGEA